MRVESLWRYPIKGLNGQALRKVRVMPSRAFAGDRAYAFARRALDDATTAWRPKTAFLQTSRDPKLATLAVPWRGEDFPNAEDLDNAERLIAATTDAPAQLVRAEDNATLSDVPHGWISCLNLASLRDLGAAQPEAGVFRANIVLGGLEPWAEEAWIGRTLRFASGAICLVRELIGRCAAVDADPNTGMANVPVRATLARHRGRARMGVYLEATNHAAIALGDAATLAYSKSSSSKP